MPPEPKKGNTEGGATRLDIFLLVVAVLALLLIIYFGVVT